MRKCMYIQGRWVWVCVKNCMCVRAQACASVRVCNLARLRMESLHNQWGGPATFEDR